MWKLKLFVAEKHPINMISLRWIVKFKAGMCVAMGTRFCLLGWAGSFYLAADEGEERFSQESLSIVRRDL